MAVNAWKVPAFGWVITIFWVLRTLPPPTGMSAVLARTADVLAPAADAAPDDDAAPVAGEAAPPGAGGPARASLVPQRAHPASEATHAAQAPVSTARRLDDRTRYPVMTASLAVEPEGREEPEGRAEPDSDQQGEHHSAR